MVTNSLETQPTGCSFCAICTQAPSGLRLATVKRSPWLAVRRVFGGFDLPLLLALLTLAAIGLVAMYSAGYDSGTRFGSHARNMLFALGVLFVVAQIPPQRLARLAVPLYALGVGLLVATMLFGVTKKGATRWLHIGVEKT